MSTEKQLTIQEVNKRSTSTGRSEDPWIRLACLYSVQVEAVHLLLG